MKFCTSQMSRRQSARALIMCLFVGMILAFPAITPAQAQITETMDTVTAYGWPDNSPPGNSIAYPVIHSVAGGTGTFSDPITFATDSRLFSPGQVIYLPRLSKYFIMEDGCVACTTDYDNGIHHIDLWTGGTASSDVQAQLNCEDSLTTTNENIIVNPDNSQPVDTSLLFDPNTGACWPNTK